MARRSAFRLILATRPAPFPLAGRTLWLDARGFTLSRGRRCVALTPTGWRIAALVLASGARPLSMRELTQLLYGERADGGPQHAGRAIHRQASFLRPPLARLGILLRHRRLFGFYAELLQGGGSVINGIIRAPCASR